jgi:hypothetical protein
MEFVFVQTPALLVFARILAVLMIATLLLVWFLAFLLLLIRFLMILLPPPNCSRTQSGAEAKLAQAQSECDSLGGNYIGNVVENNGDYCVEGECYFHSNCPSENPAPRILRRSIPERYEENPKEEDYYDYSQQCKPQPLYDALGRRTESRPETRRFLVSPKANKTAMQGIKPDIEAILRRENLTGQCCVESFGVRLVGSNSSTFFEKIGINVEFNANFRNGNGCNPSCCEFKQEAKGYIFKNDEPITETSCRIDGEYVDLDSAAYIQDCYGRDCEHFDNREGYNDPSGTYEGTDYPGLKNVEEGDSVNIKMEFNSYIKDRCNSNAVVDSLYWGFNMQGVLPDEPDSLDIILLGEISQ